MQRVQPAGGPSQQPAAMDEYSKCASLITTELIQRYLDENKQLILAILDNQNLGKFNETIEYQQRLQHNLMSLAAIADAQPKTAASPAKHPQAVPQQYMRHTPPPQLYAQQTPPPMTMQQHPEQPQRFLQGGVPQAYQDAWTTQPVQMVQRRLAMESAGMPMADPGPMGMGRQAADFYVGDPLAGGMLHDGTVPMVAASSFLAVQRDPVQQCYETQHQPMQIVQPG